jgi:hypothetical protein
MFAYLTFFGFGNHDVKIVNKRNDDALLKRKTELYKIPEDKLHRLKEIKSDGISYLPFLRSECTRIK